MDSKIKEGVVWTILTNILVTLSKVLFLVVLARLIEPKYYGINTSLNILVGFATIFTFPFLNKNILLSKKELVKESLIVSFGHSIVLVLLLSLFLPFVLQYLKMDLEYHLFFQLGILILPIMSMNNVMTTYFMRQKKYKWVNLRKLYTSIIALGIVPIILSYYFGLKHWALLIGWVNKEFLDLIFMLIKSKIYQNFTHLSKNNFKRVYENFSSITGTEVVNKLALNGDYIVISRFLGMAPLGIYSKSYELLTLPVKFISDALYSVGLSTLAKDNNNKQLQQDILTGLYKLIAYLIIPVTIFLYYSSELIIRIFFGANWLEATFAFKVFSISFFFRLAYKIPGMLLQLNRKFKVLFFVEILYAIFIISLSILFVKKGIDGVAVAVSIAILLQFLILTFFICKETSASYFKLLSVLIPPLLIAIGLFLTIELFGRYIVANFISLEYYYPSISILLLIAASLIIMLKRKKLLTYFFNFTK